MLKVFYMTFGCKVNHYETECVRNMFIDKGYESVTDYDIADIVIINSCTVTSSGDSRVLSALRKVRAKLPDGIIALMGCLPQAFPEKTESILDADIIIGTKNKSKVVELVEEFIVNKKRIVNIEKYSATDEYEEITCNDITENTRAFIKIQDGCNCFCSYCIIPYARGRCRSKSPKSLKKEVETLAEKGIQEVVLSGINLAFYGKEFGLTLADAVEIVCGIDGIKRVRLGSLEPEMMTENQLERMANQEKFCPQFHLSLQSGCDRTLKAMNRKYTSNEYALLVERIKNYFPVCNFTTDVMVGFPDETDEDFCQSLEFVKKVGFGKVHVFRYSRRKGTVADKMKNQISETIKSERWQKMNSVAEESQKNFLKSRIGMIVPVLFERESCTNFYNGHTPDYTFIKIPQTNFKKSLRNTIFYVRIIDSVDDYCIGEFID